MLTLASPSKINLFLEVLGRRPDGFHELDTVMLRTRFCDMLTAVPTAGGQLSLRFSDATPQSLSASVPLDQRNLVLRAAAAVQSRYQVAAGADFILHKQIPPESGLGGGSGNAAAALLTCRQIWNLPASDDDLHEIAASLGSDINFLLSGCRAAVCRGRGEQVDPFPISGSLHFLALRPVQGNSTPAVFRQTVLPTSCRSSKPLVEALRNAAIADIPRCCFNRLTEAAATLNPAMAELIHRLEWICRQPVCMSGSGSTVFTLCRSRQQMLELQETLLRRWKLRTWALVV
jgi:4-diphosphocytidyl-2-C-methyl-D-erythritol kinase